MRVTNNMRERMSLNDLHRSSEALAKAQSRVGSGRRVQKPSDDPIAAGEILRSTSDIEQITQYERNMVSARNRLDIEESVLNQVAGFISESRDIALIEASGNRNAETRMMSKEIVDFMLQQVIALGNTRSGSEYIFGGHEIQTKPFDDFGNYLGDTNLWQVEVEKGFTITPNRTGQELLIDTAAIQALQDLSAALGANNPSAIAAAKDTLTSSFSSLQSYLSDVGGRARQLDAIEAVSDEKKAHLVEKRSRLEDADIAEVMADYVAKQTMLQAAMVATSKSMELSLAKYI